MFKSTFLASCALALLAGVAAAQDLPAPDFSDGFARSTFYLGSGRSNEDGPDVSDDTPLVLGFTHQPIGGRGVWGLDIAREGTLLDSTYGRTRAVSPATSVNLLLGRNLVETEGFKFDGALLLGIRQSSQDCDRSYLGYRCYADMEPETEYKANIGAVTTLSFRRMVLGARATGGSAQLLAGFRF